MEERKGILRLTEGDAQALYYALDEYAESYRDDDTGLAADVRESGYERYAELARRARAVWDRVARLNELDRLR